MCVFVIEIHRGHINVDNDDIISSLITLLVYHLYIISWLSKLLLAGNFCGMHISLASH